MSAAAGALEVKSKDGPDDQQAEAGPETLLQVAGLASDAVAGRLEEQQAADIIEFITPTKANIEPPGEREGESLRRRPEEPKASSRRKQNNETDDDISDSVIQILDEFLKKEVVFPEERKSKELPANLARSKPASVKKTGAQPTPGKTAILAKAATPGGDSRDGRSRGKSKGLTKRGSPRKTKLGAIEGKLGVPAPPPVKDVGELALPKDGQLLAAALNEFAEQGAPQGPGPTDRIGKGFCFHSEPSFF